MTDTPNLALPFIESGQAQKHVTHNEALRILDAAIQIAVQDTDRLTPPAAPVEGQRHVVAAGAGGAWAGRAQAIACWQEGAWAYLVPKPGWCVWSVADDAMLVFDGAGWRAVGMPALDSVGHLGINTTADAANLLSVKSGAALFAAISAADGGSGDVRLQLSKDAGSNTASVVFSNAYSGRAEFGLIGADAFKLKVSPDGSGFAEALVIDQATGNLTLPRGLALTGICAPAALTAHVDDYAPAGLGAASVLKISADAARTISGLASGFEGRVVSVINVGSQPVTLLDESAASLAANRFALSGPLALAGRQATVLRYDGAASRWQPIAGTAAPVAGRNRLVNGRFQIDQRNNGAGTATADNAYWADRWRYLGEAAATCYAAGFGSLLPASDGAIVFAGAADKGGLLQVIEGRNCKDLRGRTVTLSAQLAVSHARLGAVKMAILEWSGAEDATSADPVASWNAEGTAPTLAANWAYRTTPVNLGIGTIATPAALTTILGTGFTNLAVLIWNDDKSYNAGDVLRATNIQLEEGGAPTAYEARAVQQEQVLCNAAPPTLIVRDEKPPGSGGGTFTSGAWRTRTLNTIVVNQIAGATLVANQITLPPGSYEIDATAPARGVDNHRAKLRNVTDGVDVISGTNGSCSAAAAGQDVSFVRGQFAISTSKVFELQHFCQTTGPTYGFGSLSIDGLTDVFTTLLLRRITSLV